MYPGQSDKIIHASKHPAVGDNVRRTNRDIAIIAEYLPDQRPAELVNGQWRVIYRVRVPFHRDGLMEAVKVIESPRGKCQWKEV